MARDGGTLTRPLDLVYFGTPEWAVPALVSLHAAGHRIRAVVTAPDAAAGRSSELQPPAVKRRALELGIETILQPLSLKPRAVRDRLVALGVDLFAVVAYGRILPGELLDHPRLGAINLHFSLLPRHRGASPVQHTLLLGDRLAGVTTMQIDRGLDSGPILLQRSTPIEPGEKSGSLGARLASIGAELLVETVTRLGAGELKGTPQQSDQATLAPLLERSDGWLRWSDSALEIERRVRAFDPWPPVICIGPKGPIRLISCRAVEGTHKEREGTVLARRGDAVLVAAARGSLLELEQIHPRSGKRMTAAQGLSGGFLLLAERLGEVDR